MTQGLHEDKVIKWIAELGNSEGLRTSRPEYCLEDVHTKYSKKIMLHKCPLRIFNPSSNSVFYLTFSFRA